MNADTIRIAAEKNMTIEKIEGYQLKGTGSGLRFPNIRPIWVVKYPKPDGRKFAFFSPEEVDEFIRSMS